MQLRTLALVAVSALALSMIAGCTTPEEPGDGPGATNAGSPSTRTSTGDGNGRDLFGSSTGGTIKNGEINQAGSSTVFPLAEAWAEEFGGERNVQIKVAGGGSGVGASKLCAKEIDLGDMSRKMRDSEKATCTANGVDPVEWKVAYDALSVVVSPKNTFAKDLSKDQLASIFKGSGHATKWNEVDPSFPAQDIHLCIPGADSGTYEYFREAILGSSSAAHRQGSGVEASEEDHILVKCINEDPYAIGYFGLAYVNEEVHAIKVNGVAPSVASVVDGTYQPLSRFIYVYTNGVPQGNLLADYLHYVLHEDGGQALIRDIGYVELDASSRQAMMAQLGA